VVALSRSRRGARAYRTHVTDSRAVIEFTDWNEVEAFGRRVAQM
jgi:menaquinone-dependent protoporphyrinogen IX oxidase